MATEVFIARHRLRTLIRRTQEELVGYHGLKQMCPPGSANWRKMCAYVDGTLLLLDALHAEVRASGDMLAHF